MLSRRQLIGPIVRGLLGLPDRAAAHRLILRDLDVWIRLDFLGVMARSGVADALATPRTIDEIAWDTAITDVDLLGAVLALGISLGELAEHRGRYRARGRRMKAICDRSTDLRGVVEELIAYDTPVYSSLVAHLQGMPAQPYDRDCADVIAAASRIAEPVLGPTVEAIAAEVAPRTVLDIGCGSGVYLRRILETLRSATGTGIDVDELVAARTAAELEHLGDRCRVRAGNIESLAGRLGAFDLVLLLNNIYYWAPERRSAILGTVRRCLVHGGTLVVATATPDGQAFNRHLDVMLRVTESSDRLPTTDELRQDLTTAGLLDVAVVEPIPTSGFVVATARR